MRECYYYQPVIRAVAKNGSERLGVHVVTQIWEPEKPRRKMELSVFGQTAKIALEKFKNSLKSENCPEPTELVCAYFLCSEAVISHFKPFEVSRPFRSGYDYDKSNYYVAWINFEEVDKFYKEVLGESTNIDFWCRECSGGTMNVSTISMKAAKKQGLFREIEQKTGLTMEKNIAYTICELSRNHGLTPVQLINKYL